MADGFLGTITGVFSLLFSHMKELVGSSGADSNVKIREVVEGENLLGSHQTAYVALQLLGATASGRADTAKQWSVQVKISIVTEVRTADGATVEILSKMAQVDDNIDAFTKTKGMAGLENGEWSITFGTDASHGNIVVADSIRNFTVMVARGGN